MEVLVIGIKEMQINEEITDKEVRLISNDGEQLGFRRSGSEACRREKSRPCQDSSAGKAARL